MPLAEGERKNDAKRPISGEGSSPKAAEACPEAILRGRRDLLISTNEAKGNRQRALAAPSARVLVRFGRFVLP